MNIKARIDRLTVTAGHAKQAKSLSPYDPTALRLLPPNELLRLHRRALAVDGDAPDDRLVAELRTLPMEELLERHRQGLGYAI